MIRLLRIGLRPYRWPIVLVLVLVLVQVIANLYLPTLNADIINNGVVTGDTAYILKVGAIMLGVTLIYVIASIAAVYWGSKTSMGLGRDTRGSLFRRIQGFSQAEVNKFGPPSLITRTTNDVQQVQMVVLMMLNVVVAAPITAIGGIIMALRLNVPLSAVILVAIPIMGVVIGLVMTRAIPLFMSMQKKIDRINQVTREFLSGVRVIRAFDRTVYEEKRFDVANVDLTTTTLKVGRIFALMFPAITIILNLSTVAIMWFGAKQIADGSMPIGDLTAFLTYIIQILFAVLMATIMFVMVPRAAVSAQRIMEVLDTQPTIVDPEQPVTDVAKAGIVEFRDVEFRYPGAEEPVLSGISFTARPGRDHRDRGQHRQRQDHAHQPHPALLRGHRRQRARGRRGRARAGAAGPVEPHRPRAAEVVPLQRQRGGQPAPRRPGGRRRAALALPRDRPGPRVRRGDARAARDATSPRAAPASPAGSASASPSPGRWPSRRRSRSTTTASRRSTSRPTPSSARRCASRPPTPR